MERDLKLELKLNLLADLWQSFCEKHTELYDNTCDEYMHLIASEMDELETTVQKKSEIIAEIDQYEKDRLELVTEIAEMLGIEIPEKMSELLAHEKIGKDISERIDKLNLVLLDIVEKIMEQNKKNQFFLNKAIHSLNELKSSFSGKANYSTYSANGTKTNNSIGY